MANIFFYREYHYFCLFNKLKVYINNEYRLSLFSYDIREINLEPNVYKIQAKLGYFKSNIIDLKVDDEAKISFLVFIDMPYWKQLPFISLYFNLKQGGILRIVQVDKRVFLEKTHEAKEGLLWR